MVKDDSLYIIAIVAVVAVVGLVIMATGSTTVVAQESLPDMVGEDSSAIAGQASRLVYSKTPSKYTSKDTGKGTAITTPTIVSAASGKEDCIPADMIEESPDGFNINNKPMPPSGDCTDLHKDCYSWLANSQCICPPDSKLLRS